MKKRKSTELPEELEQDLEETTTEEQDLVRDDYDLKIKAAKVHSPLKEINEDFTLSNLSDSMFNSRVVNFIMGRIYSIKLLALVFPYANKKAPTTASETLRITIKHQTYEYKKSRDLMLAEVYTIINMSKARGGMILKAFLEGNMTKEDLNTIADPNGGPAKGEATNRTIVDRILGRNKPTTRKI